MGQKRNSVEYTPEHECVFNVLRKIAAKGQVISYSELVKEAKLPLDMSVPYDRGQLGHLLGEISWNETILGHPMLSSVSVQANTLRQSQGFFDIAEVIYGKTFHTEDEKLLFGMKQMTDTQNYWKGKVLDKTIESLS